MLRRREEIVRLLTGNEFDYIIKDSNLFAALICYNLAIKGQKVALCQSHDFDREDNFQLTTIFPSSIKGIFNARKKLGTMESLRQVFPHLVLQQRALNIGISSHHINFLNSLFNLAATKDLHQQSMLVEIRKYPEFKHLADTGFKTAILSREYKVNLNRLTIEILKEAERAGAIIVNYIDICLNGNQITFKDQISGTDGIIKSENILKAEKTTRRVINKNIEGNEKLKNPLRIFGKFADYLITFSQNETASVEAISNIRHLIPNLSGIVKETQLLQKVIQSIDENDLNVLLTKENKEFWQDDFDLIPSLRAEEFQDNIDREFLFENSISFPKTSSCWSEDGYQLNHLLSTADQLFDEARQTGIDQEKFLQLFYRFGSQTRDITEIAYEKPAGENANPDAHWAAAVNLFEETTEWKKKKLI